MTGGHYRPAPVLAALGLLLVAATLARGERLPMRTYTSDDGLPGDFVPRIERDSSGFLWFLTSGGLCRFDGQVIERFGPEHGIPAGKPRDLLETQDGTILVAMLDGVYWLDPADDASGARFRRAHPVESGIGNIVHALYQDRSGRIWCGTQTGLYEMERVAGGWLFHPVDINQHQEPADRRIVNDLIVRPDGSLWIATAAGLIWLTADGSAQFLDEWKGLPYPGLVRIVEDREGRIWGAAIAGFIVLEPDPASGRPMLLRSFNAEDGVVDASGATARAFQIFQASDGEIWVASEAGLIRVLMEESPDAATLRVRNKSHGLTSVVLWSIAEDPEGNLWLGTADSGVMKFDRRGLVTYAADDGMPAIPRKKILEDDAGELCVVGGSRYHVFCFDGRGFSEIVPELPGTESDMGWGNETVLQDSRGEWWFGTFEGLVRFPRLHSARDLAGTPPMARYTERDGLLSDGVFSLYEDSRGDLWIGALHYTVQERNGLQRWDRASETFHWFRERDGVPHDAATALQEDDVGNIWVGFYSQGLGRFRDGVFERFDNEDGVPDGYIARFHQDARGRLWIATGSYGAVRVDDPAAVRPTFRRYGIAEGLTTDSLSCIAEDRWGRLYFGSDSGVDRLDPETGGVRHYSRLDGLASNLVWICSADRDGVLWFGTTQGLSRLDPQQDPPNTPPPVRIRSVRVAGVPRPLSPFGEYEIGGLRLGPSDRNVEVEFAGLSFLTGEDLRFQYRLEGAAAEWSTPTVGRRVHFASLSPGRYRLQVRAIDSENVTSPHPASVSFRVMPPFWMRWWFVAAVALAVSAAIYAVHRARLIRLLELERVRTRIATDLHDDIGASLSQVAILSEVASHQMDGSAPDGVKPLLGEVAGTARRVVDSMGDIVWAINPERDRASDLSQRMRSFASDTLATTGVALRFRAPENGQDRRLDLELRRQVFLIFKEAVNNAARHSECTEAEVALDLNGKGLILEVRDNGCGFDPASGSNGHGLASMRRRAEGLGGEFEVESAPGRGTRLSVRVPLDRRSTRPRRARRRP